MSYKSFEVVIQSKKESSNKLAYFPPPLVYYKPGQGHCLMEG